MWYRKHILSTETITKEAVESLFVHAEEMRVLVGKTGGNTRLTGKVMAPLFYEPSSRTFSSFAVSMQRLGGTVIPLQTMATTSVTKGETIADTARVFSSYADVLVVRHPEKGAVSEVAEHASVPVINAGDGIGEHPTQALLDLFTIAQALGRTENFSIAFIGDLAHYRPVNSLAKLLTIFPNISMTFVSPKEASLQEEVQTYLSNKHISFQQLQNWDEVLPIVDVLYVTRVKKEYMDSQLYDKIKGRYCVTGKVLHMLKKDAIILHPLPRIDEIETTVDHDPRALYFRTQIRNGMYIRMALLDLLLAKS